MHVASGRQPEQVETRGRSSKMISPASMSCAANMASPRDADTHRTAKLADAPFPSTAARAFRVLERTPKEPSPGVGPELTSSPADRRRRFRAQVMECASNSAEGGVCDSPSMKEDEQAPGASRAVGNISMKNIVLHYST